MLKSKAELNIAAKLKTGFRVYGSGFKVWNLQNSHRTLQYFSTNTPTDSPIIPPECLFHPWASLGLIRLLTTIISSTIIMTSILISNNS